MGRVRDADDADRGEVSSAPSGGADPAMSLEWIAEVAAPDETSGPPDERSNRGPFMAAVVAITIVCGLVVVAFGAGSSSNQSVEETPNAIEADSRDGLPRTDSDAVEPAVPEQPLIDQLASAPEEWLAGHVFAWVNAQGELQARALATGTDLPVSVFAETNTPPLPEHVHLLGGENSTWLLDLEAPERSGEFSNTVRIVRLGRGAGSYGFSSIDEDGATGFFVGTLWGPANGNIFGPLLYSNASVPQMPAQATWTSSSSGSGAGAGTSSIRMSCRP